MSGFSVAALFLEYNRKGSQSTEENVVLKTLAIATGVVSEADCAEWLRLSCPEKKKGAA
jgi:hypothetical protein